MKAEAVREFVRQDLPLMQRALGLAEWEARVTLSDDPLGDEDADFYAYCGVWPDEEVIHIVLDPAVHETRAALRATLLHELLHALCGDLHRVRRNSEDASVTAFTLAAEEHIVRSIEKMLRRLRITPASLVQRGKNL